MVTEGLLVNGAAILSILFVLIIRRMIWMKFDRYGGNTKPTVDKRVAKRLAIVIIVVVGSLLVPHCHL